MSVTEETSAQHPLGVVLDGLEDLFGQSHEIPAWSVPPDSLPDAAVRAGRLVARAQALFAQLVGEVDEQGLPDGLAATSAVAWLRHRLCLAPREAVAVVAVAWSVRSECSAVGDALAAGEISMSHAAVVARAVTELPAEVDAETRLAAERTLIAESARYHPGPWQCR